MDKFIVGWFSALAFVLVGTFLLFVQARKTCLEVTGAPQCERLWTPVYPDSDY